jgi:hypothetical protein
MIYHPQCWYKLRFRVLKFLVPPGAWAESIGHHCIVCSMYYMEIGTSTMRDNTHEFGNRYFIRAFDREYGEPVLFATSGNTVIRGFQGLIACPTSFLAAR